MMKLKSFTQSSTFKAITISALALIISACSPAPEENNKAQIIQAVKLVPVMNGATELSRTFPAEVSAVKTIDLSFEVSGRLTQNSLLTGTLAEQGQVLAQIDPTPFEQRLQEAQTRLTQATRDLKRVETTAKNGLASQSQLDNAKTNFELAEIALSKAQKDLSYTKLSAPFNAQISERLVENGNYVKAGEVIARLQDVSLFYFNVNVPERLLSSYQQGSLLNTQAHIISAPDTVYDLEYIEHATQPDPITQTYKVVFAARSNSQSLTPGARAVVKVSVAEQNSGNTLMIPLQALQGSNNDGFHVWKFNQQDATVSKQSVNVINVSSDMVTITAGLSQTDLIVAAGAPQMREGLAVKPYKAEL